MNASNNVPSAKGSISHFYDDIPRVLDVGNRPLLHRDVKSALEDHCLHRVFGGHYLCYLVIVC